MSIRMLLRWALTFALLAGAIVIVVHQHQGNASLKATLDKAHATADERGRLLAERDRLRSLIAASGDTSSLAELNATRARLSEEIASLKVDLEKRAALTPQPQPPSPVWRDAGRASAPATFESVMHAATGGDWFRLAGMLAFEADALAEAETFFASVPADMQADYESPHALVAAVMAGKIPGMSDRADVVEATYEADGRTVLHVDLSRKGLPPRRTSFHFRYEGDGYKLLVPAAIVAGYRYAVTGDSDIGAPAPLNP